MQGLGTCWIPCHVTQPHPSRHTFQRLHMPHPLPPQWGQPPHYQSLTWTDLRYPLHRITSPLEAHPVLSVLVGTTRIRLERSYDGRAKYTLHTMSVSCESYFQTTVCDGSGHKRGIFYRAYSEPPCQEAANGDLSERSRQVCCTPGLQPGEMACTRKVCTVLTHPMCILVPKRLTAN